MRISEFFEEEDNCLSLMRLMSFLSLLQAFGLSWYCLLSKTDKYLDLIILFVLGAFVPKVFQKFAELMPVISNIRYGKPPKKGDE